MHKPMGDVLAAILCLLVVIGVAPEIVWADQAGSSDSTQGVARSSVSQDASLPRLVVNAGPGYAATSLAFSATGLMHGYAIANGAIVNAYGPSHTWPFVLGYGGIAVVFLVLGMRERRA